MRTKFSAIFILICLFTLISYGQEPPAAESRNPKIPIKIDEFGSTNECDVGARIDYLYIELNNNLADQGYIITYKGADQLPGSFQADSMKAGIQRAMKFRKFDVSRVTFIDGGFREAKAAELFLVPPGVKAPLPTNTVPAPKMPVKKTFLFDRSYLVTEDMLDFMEGFILPSIKAGIEEERRRFEEEDEKEQETAGNSQPAIEESAVSTAVEEPELTAEEIESSHFTWTKEDFGEQIAKRKNAKGLMIYYADDQYYDIGSLYGLIDEGKRRIALAGNLSPDKIEIFYGGYRSNIEVEYWIIPKDGEFPKATPEERPV